MLRFFQKNAGTMALFTGANATSMWLINQQQKKLETNNPGFKATLNHDGMFFPGGPMYRWDLQAKKEPLEPKLTNGPKKF